jgi:hypothetical protein
MLIISGKWGIISLLLIAAALSAGFITERAMAKVSS